MPAAKASEFQHAARKLGFEFVRQAGRHARWQHKDGRAVTIPVHGSQDIGSQLFFLLLRQMGVTLEEFRNLK